MLEDRLLAIGAEGGLAEVLVGEEGRFAATGGAFDEAFLDEVGFIDILDRTGVFAHGCCDRIEADRSATELIDDGKQQFVIDLIETEGINIESFEGVLGDLEVDGTVTLDLCEVTYATQESVGNTGVPRERRAISPAASSLISTFSRRAERLTIPARMSAS